MDIFENFSALFVEVWKKGILGVDIFQILIGLAKLSNDKIFLKSELFSNDGKKKFEFRSSGNFSEAKEIGYKVGEELLKKAGSDFITQGN